MTTIPLNGQWKLYYHREEGETPDTPEALLQAGWPSVEAHVPGNVELDLYKAGIEPDPFFGENLYKYTKYEYYQWWFYRTFDVPELPEKTGKAAGSEKPAGENYVLCFEGLDTFAAIFCNSQRVGSVENMFIRHEFDISHVIKPGNNEIFIRIESPMNKAKQKEYPMFLSSVDQGKFQEMVWLRKAPHSFGWDIMPRFLSAGMWRDVSIEKRKATRIQSTYFATMAVQPRSARVCFGVDVEVEDTMMEKYSIRFTGSCRNSEFSFETPMHFISMKQFFTVDNPLLWWPRGLGEPNLYTVTTELLKDGEVVDSKVERFGIRKAEIDAVYDRGLENRFNILINGKKLLALGSNWVPLDAFHSRDAERLETAMKMINDLSCNIIRCWGGNVYEDHQFYDICDENGILVWQDFALACGVYPHNDEFYTMVREEVDSVVKKLRNHPCILLWAGDNEIDAAYQWMHYNELEHTRHNVINREIIPAGCRDHDPYRFYIPSSPYFPEDMDMQNEYPFTPEQHNWGPRDYFKGDFYKNSFAAFISETGYHGCPAASSLRQFISQEKLWPPHDNREWDTHNTDYLPAGRRRYNRIQLMTDQVETLFGEVPEDMERYIAASQISQAEAKKYFIERVRIQRNRMGGVIWWNLLDGWPQISDAVVDYYFTKKIAYHYIKRSQQPVCVLMDELDSWTHDIYVDNNTERSVDVSLSITKAVTGEVIHQDVVSVGPQSIFYSGAYRSLPGRKELYTMEWNWEGGKGANHYISGYPPFDLDRYISWLHDIIEKLPPSFDSKECIS